MVGESNPAKSEQFLDKKEWHEQARESILEAQERGQAVSVLLIDINRFKLVNDKLGHPIGDQVIAEYRELVDRVAGELRKNSHKELKDLVGISQKDTYGTDGSSLDIETYGEKAVQPRIRDISVGGVGGDEIAVVAHTDSLGADVITQRIREAFSGYLNDPAKANLKELRLGLAVGSASYYPSGHPFDPELSSKLYSDADANMYKDKIKQRYEALPDVTPERIQTMIEIEQKLAANNLTPEEFLDFHNKCFAQEVELEQ